MKETEKTKILIVDDSQEVRERLSSTFDKMPEVEIVGTAANGMTAIEMISRLKCMVSV